MWRTVLNKKQELPEADSGRILMRHVTRALHYLDAIKRSSTVHWLPFSATSTRLRSVNADVANEPATAARHDTKSPAVYCRTCNATLAGCLGRALSVSSSLGHCVNIGNGDSIGGSIGSVIECTICSSPPPPPLSFLITWPTGANPSAEEGGGAASVTLLRSQLALMRCTARGLKCALTRPRGFCLTTVPIGFNYTRN
ncbi:unnamed protein product, partial [Iphiclides podalirius]